MWQQVRVYNPRNLRSQRRFFTQEGHVRPRATKKTVEYQFIHGSAPVRRSIARHRRKKSSTGSIFNARRRNQGPLTDALAGEVANRVIKFMKAAPARKRKATAKRKRRNTPLRKLWTTYEGKSRGTPKSMTGYYERVGSKPVRKSISRHKRKAKKRGIFSNPALAVIGLNPKRKTKRRATMATRRRKRNLPRRNAKGRFVRRKANPVRRKRRAVRRRRNPVLNPRRRRHVRATPRRRRRRSNPVRTHRRRRTNVMAHRRRRRRSRNPVLNPRRRRRATVRHRRRTRRHNPVVRHRRRRNRRYTRRRNAGGIGGFIGRIDWKSVLFVSGGVFFGDKLTGIISDKIVGMTTMIPASAGPWVKVAVGVLAAGLAWKFQPALGLGIAVGATNSLLNQYVFGPAWGYVAPSLGVSGFGDYMTRSFKQDNWIGQATGANLQGMGNPLLSKGL